MEFPEIQFEKFLPLYYDDVTRDRIKSGLSGFCAERGKDFEYPNFYTTNTPDYLLQSDILNSIRTVDWDGTKGDFIPIFSSGMLISNTCDVAPDNVRNINEKHALIAPILELSIFFDELNTNGYDEPQIKELHRKLKEQAPSNVIYLPPNFINGKEYIVFLDKISWIPISQLTGGYETIIDNRFIGLTNWAFYLFLFKVAYHFARLGDSYDRRAN